ncbi:MAG TPA: hypothetical protein VFC67_24575 [Prolixibacteraceae bacterium]|nr:hypothetical protein [Prolixibacteraceae bacterium]
MMNINNKRKQFDGNSISRGKTLLFKIIGLILPLLILLLLELTLRVIHYGNDLSLFIESSENKNYLTLNPYASKKYFSNQAMATKGNSEPFRKKKEKGVTRIFILGESTTIGYPYYNNGAFHRWLKYRLMFTCPDKKFEIINISLTAVNSYTILGFSKDAVSYEPDAILIYTGHNEYYGCMGVASTDKIMGNSFVVSLVLNLREIRFVQLLTSVYGKIAGPNKDLPGATRMKMMVADSKIAYNSNLYFRGIEQFRNNMDKTLNLFNKHHIPVFLSNLVSNDKDLKPFISIPNDSSKYAGFGSNFNLGQKEFENNNLISAYEHLNKANEIYGGHALCNYYLAQLAYKSGDFILAKKYFTSSRDFDGLRFRAPDKLNTIIADLSKKYPNTHLVDTKGLFEKYTKENIIGKELILDHVHPNLTGYALMSEAFFEAMKKEKVFSAINEREFSFPQLLKQMPVTKVDSLVGVYRISLLQKSWPFSEALQRDSISVYTTQEKIAWSLALNKISWKDATKNLVSYYENEGQPSEAGKALEALALEYPLNSVYSEDAARIFSNLNNFEKALIYFKKTFDLAPTFDDAKYIFAIYLKLDRPLDAIPYLDYAIQNNTKGLNLLSIKTEVAEIIQLKRQLAKNPSDLTVINKIAYSYLKMGNKDGAKIYLDIALLIDSRNPDALAMLKQIVIKEQ